MTDTPMLDKARNAYLATDETMKAIAELRLITPANSWMPFEIRAYPGFAAVLTNTGRQISSGPTVEDALLECRAAIEAEMAA